MKLDINDNIGEDSLSSQSTYAYNIEDEDYLRHLSPSSMFLAREAVTAICLHIAIQGSS
jgi:hypothetical protein